MPITVNDTTAKNSLLTALSTAVGAGGSIEVQDSSNVVLAQLAGLSFGSPSSGSMTFTATADASNNATGTANKLVFKTSGGTTIFTIPSADITWSPSSSVTSGGTATLTSGTITA